MKVELPLLQTAVPEYPHTSTSAEIAVGADHRLHSLHRSKLVYQCDVFSHSVAAGGPSPFSACLPESFLENCAVGLSKDKASSHLQRSFHHCSTSSRAESPVEDRRDLSFQVPHWQSTHRATMEDLFQLSSHEQEWECANRVPPQAPLTGPDWLYPSSGSQTCNQQQELELHQSRLAHLGDPQDLGQATSQRAMENHGPSSLWNFERENTNGCQLSRQKSTGRSDAHGLFSSHAVPQIPIPSSKRYAYPLTPPSSTRDEIASPADETADSQLDTITYAPKVTVDPLSTPLGGSTTPKKDLTVPPTSQHLSPELTWSNEEFAKFLSSDLYLTDFDSVDRGLNEQLGLNIGWHHENSAAPPGTGQPCTQNKQREWHVAASNQLNYSDPYPPLPTDIFDQANGATNPCESTPNYDLDMIAAPLQPESSTALSSLFDSLKPGLGSPTIGRRNGTKAQQRENAKDRQLIEWKNQGLSYKEIKARGGFDEAESTLRGRYRTLTKPKHLRVRKPEWQQQDVTNICQLLRARLTRPQVQILLEAVDHHLQSHPEECSAQETYPTGAQRKAAKVPWKQVAEYMEKRGCYRYGNATVKKKYLKVLEDPLNF